MNTRIEQLLDIFDHPVSSGNLISKHERDALIRYGLVRKEFSIQTGDINVITERGKTLCRVLGLRK